MSCSQIFPATASLDVPAQSTKFVMGVSYSQIDSANGLITATAQGDSAISGSTVVLTGAMQPNGQVVWTCSGTILPKYRPSSCQ